MRLAPRYDMRGGLADFWTEFRRPQPYRWPILLVSCAIPGVMIYTFTQEGGTAPPARPEVTFITSFAPDRTDEEIIASNEENQRNKEAREALAEAQQERRQAAYRALGRATGIDVDQMEADIAAEEAEAEAERQAALEEAGAASGEAPSSDPGE